MRGDREGPEKESVVQARGVGVDEDSAVGESGDLGDLCRFGGSVGNEPVARRSLTER